MQETDFCNLARSRRGKSTFRSSVILLLACCALVLTGSSALAAAQAAPNPEPASPPTAPSAGKALIIIYRTYRFVGSASHDHLYVNGVYLAYLHNDEYAATEVDPGTVVITGLPEMYYGSIIQSAGAALNDARKKENERIRFDAEAGKTYYLKWTAGTMATAIKVTPVDAATGTKEMKKLHLAKAVDPNGAKKEEKK
ncbi:MAG: DUF2846 domain-containing protein [Terracidiphilus sp.]|nr:DUF2846 domain-containing protein [Terracidiphilus sp.]MDR3776282.1 DUF2846 domain-containing protein [Terracidiphilus sp.]